MVDEVYLELADALDRLPNGFPRTESGVEIAILKKIFSSDEAYLASQLTHEFEPGDQVAERVGFTPEKVESLMTNMAKRGLVWYNRHSDKLWFRLAPWLVGIYEAQLETMDHKFAHLVEEYFTEGGLEGIMKPLPSIHRVIPSRSAVKTEWILPYDDVKKIINSNKTFSLRDCVCRVQQEHVGRKCDFPLKTCLSISSRERPPRPNDISKKDALALLDKVEEIGLVHTVSNVMEGLSYICNCCGCCCGILRGITEFGIQNSVAQANYFAVIDPENCIGCEACMNRCQVNAISMENGLAVVDREHCIGCGLCATGCLSEAAKLKRKPEDEVLHPPRDFASWELQRLKNRGLMK